MRNRAALVALIAVASFAGGCKPRVFSDANVLAVIGEAPPPPVEEEPPPPEQIELREKVQFAVNSSRILSESYPVLDEVADKIASAPDIRRIRIEGHASSDGNDDRNMKLSADRAAAVRKYLIKAGIAEDMLESEGYGETQPIADNDTPEGREANRRVELHVVERAEASSGDAEEGAAEGSAEASAAP